MITKNREIILRVCNKNVKRNYCNKKLIVAEKICISLQAP